MRNAMKIGLALAALVAAGVYSVSAEDVSQQSRKAMYWSLWTHWLAVYRRREPIGMAWSKRSASRRARRSPNRTS